MIYTAGPTKVKSRQLYILYAMELFSTTAQMKYLMVSSTTSIKRISDSTKEKTTKEIQALVKVCEFAYSIPPMEPTMEPRVHARGVKSSDMIP